jgi:hypothetical protein
MGNTVNDRKTEVLEWSADDHTEQRSSTEQAAYKRACAAFIRLQSLSEQVNEMRSQSTLSSDPRWCEYLAQYIELRREWNDAFDAFDEAVCQYRLALLERPTTHHESGDYRPPR